MRVVAQNLVRESRLVAPLFPGALLEELRQFLAKRVQQRDEVQWLSPVVLLLRATSRRSARDIGGQYLLRPLPADQVKELERFVGKIRDMPRVGVNARQCG